MIEMSLWAFPISNGMKLQRFFVEEKLSVGKEIKISDEDFAFH
jgi:hypothetical protein